MSDARDDELTQGDSTVTRRTRDNRDLTPEERAERKAEAIRRRIVASERKLRVFALRRSGASYRQIAKETGLAVSRCHQIVDGELAVLTEQLSHSREQLRALELERLDGLLLRLEGFLREGRKTERVMRDGKLVDQVVVMRRPSVGYFFAYTRVLERRAKLLGIDAPTKLELSTPKPERELPNDVIDRRIGELQQQIAAADARTAQRAEKGSVH